MHPVAPTRVMIHRERKKITAMLFEGKFHPFIDNFLRSVIRLFFAKKSPESERLFFSITASFISLRFQSVYRFIGVSPRELLFNLPQGVFLYDSFTQLYK